MPITTRQDLEAMEGHKVITELLRHGADGLTGPELLEHEQARLNAALEAGDALISQFLPLPAPGSEVPLSLRQFAREEAFWWLQSHSKGGAPESADLAMQQRRRDLADMRGRKQMPGSPKGQALRKNRVVPSAGQYRSDQTIF